MHIPVGCSPKLPMWISINVVPLAHVHRHGAGRWSREQRRNLLQDSSHALSSAFYEEELCCAVLDQGVSTRDECHLAKRTGRGMVLKRDKSDAIWPVFKEHRA